MRGKVAYIVKLFLCFRITPAYAGKSVFISKIGTFFKDHPRLCGEKFHTCCILPRYGGSPPPMRGKVRSSFEQTALFGITPAYAGKSGTA